MTDQGTEVSIFTVLFVCTGNICRSAFAERLGRAYLHQRLGEAAGTVRLMSAGTRAVVDSAMHPDSVQVLHGFGAMPGDFRARQLLEIMPAEADLILTMTRPHRRELLQLAPRALHRTFTLREAADLLRLVGPGVHPIGNTLPSRARALVKDMAAVRGRRHSGPDDDIDDPIGQTLEVHAAVGEVIVDALLPVLSRIAAQHVSVGTSKRV